MQTAHGGANTGNHARAANGTTALARRLPAAAEYAATARQPPAPPPHGAKFLVHAKFLRLASYGRSTPLPFSMIICCQSTIESDFFSCFFCLLLLPDTCCVCCSLDVPGQPALVLSPLDCRAAAGAAESPRPFVHPQRRVPPPRRRNCCFWLKNDA